jgi:hypothetical protein
MVHYTKVISGLERYVRNEILAQLNGNIAKWIGGTFVSLVTTEAESVFRTVAQNEIVRAFNVIDGENVNVEKVYPLLLAEARQGAATVTMKFLPPITFTEKDVESLFRYIKE